MEKYTVYHAKNPTFGMDWPGDDLGTHPPDFADLSAYEKVAVVESMTLGDVFRITNHIDEEWQKNPEVVESVDYARSTSVGDIVVHESGAAYLCNFSGWHPITLTPEEPDDMVELAVEVFLNI
jgi:hypothetical protein